LKKTWRRTMDQARAEQGRVGGRRGATEMWRRKDIRLWKRRAAAVGEHLEADRLETAWRRSSSCSDPHGTKRRTESDDRENEETFRKILTSTMTLERAVVRGPTKMVL